MFWRHAFPGYSTHSVLTLVTEPHTDIIEGNRGSPSASPYTHLHLIQSMCLVPSFSSTADSWNPNSGFGSYFCSLHLGQSFPDSLGPVVTLLSDSALNSTSPNTGVSSFLVSSPISSSSSVIYKFTRQGREGKGFRLTGKLLRLCFFSFQSSPRQPLLHIHTQRYTHECVHSIWLTVQY